MSRENPGKVLAHGRATSFCHAMDLLQDQCDREQQEIELYSGFLGGEQLLRSLKKQKAAALKAKKSTAKSSAKWRTSSPWS